MAIMNLVINVILVLLLAGALAYAVRLQRQIKAWREDKTSFAELVKTLTVNVTAAERSVAALKSTALDLGERLQDQITRGSQLRDEMHYMLDAANQTVDRLVAQMGQAKTAMALMQQHAADYEPAEPREAPAPRAASNAQGHAPAHTGLGPSGPTTILREGAAKPAHGTHGHAAEARPAAKPKTVEIETPAEAAEAELLRAIERLR